MPAASGADHSREKPNHLRAMKIDHSPVDQIGLDDSGETAQQQRTGKAQFPGCGDGKETAENDGGDLDVELGPHRLLDRLCETRQEIGDDEPDDQRENIGALVGELQRPGDTEFLLLGGRHRGKVRVIADDPAGIGNPENRGEGEREFPDIGLECGGAGSKHQRERGVGCDQGPGATKRGVSLGDGAERLAEIRPDRRADDPADQVGMDQTRQGQYEDGEAEDDSEPVFVETSLVEIRGRYCGGSCATMRMDFSERSIGHSNLDGDKTPALPAMKVNGWMR
jgi:hypothetical protein